MAELPPLALYVHTPWCVRKCPYCDFNSHEPGQGSLPESAYLDALIADLDNDLALLPIRTLTSVFIGGGTPSLLSAGFYHRLFEALRARLPFAPDIEITLEANPGTTEQGRFDGYRQAGINRLSLGVQSFQPAQLRALGRIHSGTEAIEAVHQARVAGFDDINIDLMHGLPDQDLKSALADIDQALALQPQHLSWYQLTLEPNTAFYSRPPALPEEEVLWDIQDAGHARLEAHGLSRYEISAYARPGFQSRHNLNYWQFGDYLGIGAGAHAKLTYPDKEGLLLIERRSKTRQPDAYLRRRHDPRGFVSRRQLIADNELPLEFAMNALRLTDGVALSCWEARTGRSRQYLLESLRLARVKGLLSDDAERLQASPRGLLFLNELLNDIAET